MHALYIAADGFCPEWHCAIHPRADPRGAAALDGAAEAGRDFNRSLDVSALETLIELGIVGERQLLHEIGRASELFEICAALVALISIEHREREIVDVGRNSKAEHQH